MNAERSDPLNHLHRPLRFDAAAADSVCGGGVNMAGADIECGDDGDNNGADDDDNTIIRSNDIEICVRANLWFVCQSQENWFGKFWVLYFCFTFNLLNFQSQSKHSTHSMSLFVLAKHSISVLKKNH